MGPHGPIYGPIRAHMDPNPDRAYVQHIPPYALPEHHASGSSKNTGLRSKTIKFDKKKVEHLKN